MNDWKEISKWLLAESALNFPVIIGEVPNSQDIKLQINPTKIAHKNSRNSRVDHKKTIVKKFHSFPQISIKLQRIRKTRVLCFIFKDFFMQIFIYVNEIFRRENSEKTRRRERWNFRQHLLKKFT